jgi:endonuclease/exonuclease/phosphatase family metal-dependent hydrolase
MTRRGRRPAAGIDFAPDSIIATARRKSANNSTHLNSFRGISVSVTFSLRRLVVLTFAAALSAGVATAQTTITLNTAETHVTDSTIGSGTRASTVMNNDRLTARASTDVNAVRRAFVKFDTQNTIPAGSTITSAKMTLFVRGAAGSATRTIGVYPVTKSFTETQVTWNLRKTGYSWVTKGGDLGARTTSVSVPLTAGTAVTVDVTAAVQQAVKSTSSRYTRLALVDISSADSSSYRDFHSSESADVARRPKLVVVYGGVASVPTPAPPPPSTTTSTLKLLDWNVQYGGMGTDGVFNPDRVIDFIAKVNPDVISLNEVTRYYRYDTRRDMSVYYRDQLKAKTGRTWYSYFRTANGATNYYGNMVLSRFPIASTSYCQLSGTRVAVNAAIYVNGRLLNIWSTHLDSTDGNSMRLTQTRQLHACVGSFAEQKIIAGDFNAGPSTTEIKLMASGGFYDAWAKAAAAGTAVSYPGNTSFGATRNGRIDYVWYSTKATALVLKRAEVLDSRDANGVRPSDHKPLLVTFEVR